MEIISINGLRLRAFHGVLEHERELGNEFELNIKLVVPAAVAAMTSDNLRHTVNYARVVEIAKEEMAIPCQLLEAVVGRIEQHIVNEFGEMIAGGSITLSKLAPPIPAFISSVSFTHTWGAYDK